MSLKCRPLVTRTNQALSPSSQIRTPSHNELPPTRAENVLEPCKQLKSSKMQKIPDVPGAENPSDAITVLDAHVLGEGINGGKRPHQTDFVADSSIISARQLRLQFPFPGTQRLLTTSPASFPSGTNTGNLQNLQYLPVAYN